MQMRLYHPYISVAIPADIPAEHHNAIRARIYQANRTLEGYSGVNRRGALDLAAAALANSGVGACGIARAARVPKIRAVASAGSGSEEQPNA